MTTTPAADLETAAQRGEMITVTVRDRSREAPWGSGLTRPVIRRIEISAFCPNCGARRGDRQWLHTYDDGEHYWVETWTCSAACGHVDRYEDVVVEAARLAAADPGPDTATEDRPMPASISQGRGADGRVSTIITPLGPVQIDDVSGPHTVVGLGEYCGMCCEALEPGDVIEYVLAPDGIGIVHERLGCVGEGTSPADERAHDE